jgi:hypothetical protein
MIQKTNTNPHDGLIPIKPPRRAIEGRYAPMHDPAAIWPQILNLISNGHALTTALDEIPDAPSYPWCKAQLRDNPELRQRYREAVDDRADYRANEILSIADTPLPEHLDGSALSAWIQQQRLRVDARKWIAARLAPRQWGDRLEVVTETHISITKALEEAHRRVIDIDDVRPVK